MPKSEDLIRKWQLEEEHDERYTLIKLKIPGGFLCGKWWGPKDVRPILCLHGWMDNCGVFDRLIPLLPPEFSYLTFDLPGHGLSSKYGAGMIYSFHDTTVIIERIRREYNWPKVSLIGHSLTGVCGFSYAALFDDKIDMFVALDNFQNFHHDPIPLLKLNAKKLLVEDARRYNSFETEPPAYNYEELVDRLASGSQGSIDRDSARYLLTRNVKRSSKHPNKYFFRFDGRLRGFNRYPRPVKEVKYYANYVVCPILFCLGRDSYIQKDNREANEELFKHFKSLNKSIEVFEGPGNHHFFLTHPEHYAVRISSFIRKHRILKNKL